MVALRTVKAAAAIVLGCIGLACALGISMDMVTAHVAVEYFTVHHPKVIKSQEPWAMALLWGVIASWWFGAIAGVVLALVNRALRPPVAPGRVLAAVARACLVLWMVATAIVLGVYLIGDLVPVAQRKPEFEHDRRLMAVAMAHLGEYVIGGIAVVIVALRIRWLSRQDATNSSLVQTGPFA